MKRIKLEDETENELEAVEQKPSEEIDILIKVEKEEPENIVDEKPAEIVQPVEEAAVDVDTISPSTTITTTTPTPTTPTPRGRGAGRRGGVARRGRR